MCITTVSSVSPCLLIYYSLSIAMYYGISCDATGKPLLFNTGIYNPLGQMNFVTKGQKCLTIRGAGP